MVKSLNMKFQRGRDPKKAMRIGVGSQSVWLKGIYERVENMEGEVHFRLIKGSEGHKIFEDIQKNGLHKRHISYEVHTGGSQGHLKIGWLSGRWVEYLKKYYYIPENEKIR